MNGSRSERTFRFPSAVSRRRLQVEQKLLVMDEMKPTRPRCPGTCHTWVQRRCHLPFGPSIFAATNHITQKKERFFNRLVNRGRLCGAIAPTFVDRLRGLIFFCRKGDSSILILLKFESISRSEWAKWVSSERGSSHPGRVVGARQAGHSVGEAPGEGPQRDAVRHQLRVFPLVAAERHELDEAHLHLPRARVLHEVHYLVVVEPCPDRRNTFFYLTAESDGHRFRISNNILLILVLKVLVIGFSCVKPA